MLGEKAWVRGYIMTTLVSFTQS